MCRLSILIPAPPERKLGFFDRLELRMMKWFSRFTLKMLFGVKPRVDLRAESKIIRGRSGQGRGKDRDFKNRPGQKEAGG